MVERIARGPVALYCGRFTEVKRLPLLIEAFADARRRTGPASLVLVGGHPGEWEGEHPLETIARLGLEDVYLAGWYGQEELPQLLNAADVFALASAREAFGQVLVEAMACGVPAIAANALGPASIVIDGETGWLFGVDDHDQLVDVLVEALTDADERARRAATAACRCAGPVHVAGPGPAAGGDPARRRHWRSRRRGCWIHPMRRNLADADLTEAVVASFSTSDDPRFRQIAESLVRHLHAFADDVQLTEAEWFAGIDFLTRTGHITDDQRQEFVLLSDVLGLSMQVIGINHRHPGGATESTVFGPFFVDGSPAFDNGDDIAAGAPGRPCFMSGRILDVRRRADRRRADRGVAGRRGRLL